MFCARRATEFFTNFSPNWTVCQWTWTLVDLILRPVTRVSFAATYGAAVINFNWSIKKLKSPGNNGHVRPHLSHNLPITQTSAYYRRRKKNAYYLNFCQILMTHALHRSRPCSLQTEADSHALFQIVWSTFSYIYFSMISPSTPSKSGQAGSDIQLQTTPMARWLSSILINAVYML